MPQLLALAASLAFGIGSYFEKKGLHIADLPPQVGITVRTLTAVIVLAVISFPEWKSLTRANPKGVWMIVLGGGVLAGAIGLLCFYAAMKGAPLTTVMPIAFTSPLIGAAMAVIFGGEPLTWKTAIGMLMTVGGIVVITTG